MTDDICIYLYTCKCSISNFSAGQCDRNGYYPKENGIVLLKDCDKNIVNHLSSVKLVFCGKRDVSSEGELICKRVGLFTTGENLNVFPYHRYKLGINFKQGKKCLHPLHSRNGRVYRGLTAEKSQSILQNHGILVPMGSAVCQKCYHSMQTQPKFEDHTEDLLKRNLSQVDQTAKTDSCTQMAQFSSPTNCSEKTHNQHHYTLREKCPATNEEPSLFDSQSSVSLQEHVSQISSWSDDMDTSLDDINNSLQIISHGSIM